jgi:tRNA threonylcarbamoyladenosine biosynthesis protein TsaE
MKIEVNSLVNLEEAAIKIFEIAGQEKVFLFYGEMGAGKTTLINKICTYLGTKDHTSSPTFSIVNEYLIPNGSIFHFDFYRLKNQSEAFDLGYEDYFYSGNYCMVEWPQKIADLLPEKYLKIEIEAVDENKRIIEASLIIK